MNNQINWTDNCPDPGSEVEISEALDDIDFDI